MRTRSPLALSSVIALALAGLVATPAHAATFPVATGAELVTAINDANANGTADIIQLTGTSLTLPADLPSITETLTITGPGSGTFTIDAAGFTVFRSIGSGTNTQFSASGITIEDAGLRVVDTDGLDVVLDDLIVDSAIVHSFGDFSATDVDVLGAPIAEGFFLFVSGTDDVDLTRVTVTATREEGIDITASGASTVTLTDVTVSGAGTAGFNGLDASVTDSARIDVIDSDFSDNVEGKGVRIQSSSEAVVELNNVTADRNGADGIDIDADDDSNATIRNCSASDNGDEGFESASGGGTLLLENVTAERNVEDGFDLEADDGSMITVINPIAIDNGEDGVLVEPDTADATVIVTGGLAEGNGGYGMHMNVDQGTITSDGFVARDNDSGGVYIDGFNGQATLLNATVSDNNALTAGSRAGGVSINAHDGSGPLDVVIENTTINNNVTDSANVNLDTGVGDVIGLYGGGGVGGALGGGSTLTILNSTISGNEADLGGAVSLVLRDDPFEEPPTPGGGMVTIAHSTITANETSDSGSAAVDVEGLTLTIFHTIIAENAGGSAVSDLVEDDTVLDIDFSVVRTADALSLAALTAGTGNIVGESAGLGPLANNGGPTRTHLPLAGSPAIGGGNAAIAGAPETDQRGDDRVVGVIEIGAVEIQGPELAATGARESIATLAAGIALLLVLGGSLLMVVRRRSTESIAR